MMPLSADPTFAPGLGKFGDGLFESEGVDEILIENNKRFVMFPLNYHNIWDVYKRQESLFWTAEDINFSADSRNIVDVDNKDLSELIERCIAYLSLQNIMDSYPIEGCLCDIVQAPEARCVFGFQIMQKNIHMELFSKALSEIMNNISASAILANKVSAFRSLKCRRLFMEAYIRNEETHYSIKLVALIASVYILSSAPTLMLLSIGTNHYANVDKIPSSEETPLLLLPGTVYGLSKVHKDARIFAEFCTILFRRNLQTCPKAEVAHHIIMDAVKVEMELLKDLMADNLVKAPDMNLIRRAIMSRADEAAVAMEYPAIFNEPNTMSWSNNYLVEVFSLNDHDKDTKAGISTSSKASAFVSSLNDTEQSKFRIGEDF